MKPISVKSEKIVFVEKKKNRQNSVCREKKLSETFFSNLIGI